MSTGDIHDVMVEVGLVQDALCGDKDLTDVPLRSCWEGIRFVNQSLSDLSVVTLPLLNVKSNENSLIWEVDPIGVGFLTVEHRYKGLEVLLRTIESECTSQFARLNKLYSFCSGGTGNQTGEAFAIHLNNIVEILLRLPLDKLLCCILPPSVTINFSSFYSLASFSVELDLIRSAIVNLISRIDQDAVEIGGSNHKQLRCTKANKIYEDSIFEAG